jgi:hypothetical protein
MAVRNGAEMSAWLWLIGINCVLVLLVVRAAKLPGLVRLLVIAQAVYWWLSYVLLPFILLWLKPLPAFADSIADPRLSNDGYTSSIGAVLAVVMAGITAYLLLITLSSRWIGALFRRQAAASPNKELGPIFAICFCIGLASRIGTLAGITNPVVGVGLYVGTAGSVGLISLYRSESRRRTLWIIAMVGVVEVSWSVLEVSKTPALAACLGIAIRLSRSARWSRRKVTGLGLLALVMMSAVLALQSLKLSDSVAADLDSADAAYPVVVQPLLPVVRRFDLFAAVTDAESLGAGNWIGPGEFAKRVAVSVVPNVFQTDDKLSAGVLWAQEVRSYSRPDSGTNVSLAEGFVAEGYALGGLAMVFLEAFVLMLLLIGISRLLMSVQVYAVGWGVMLIGYPILFERGILGSVEVISKTLQAAIVIFVLVVILRSRRNGLSGRSELSERRHQATDRTW